MMSEPFSGFERPSPSPPLQPAVPLVLALGNAARQISPVPLFPKAKDRRKSGCGRPGVVGKTRLVFLAGHCLWTRRLGQACKDAQGNMLPWL